MRLILMQMFIYLPGLIVENGSFEPQKLMGDITSASTDVFVLIGIGLLAAIGLGIAYAIWLIITNR